MKIRKIQERTEIMKLLASDDDGSPSDSTTGSTSSSGSGGLPKRDKPTTIEGLPEKVTTPDEPSRSECSNESDNAYWQRIHAIQRRNQVTAERQKQRKESERHLSQIGLDIEAESELDSSLDFELV